MIVLFKKNFFNHKNRVSIIIIVIIIIEYYSWFDLEQFVIFSAEL